MRGTITYPNNGFLMKLWWTKPPLRLDFGRISRFPVSVEWFEGAQTWRLQRPIEFQIDDNFQRFGVLMVVYHVTLQVQQVCQMSSSALWYKCAGWSGIWRALEMRSGRDQTRIQFVWFKSEPAEVQIIPALLQVRGSHNPGQVVVMVGATTLGLFLASG